MPKTKSVPAPLNTPDQAAAGKGIPAKTPLPQRSRPGKHGTPADGSVESSLTLPHERDQSLDMTSDTNSAHVEQAARDLKKGVKDTSKAPEMEEAYRKLGK